jgi:hypothetical protein
VTCNLSPRSQEKWDTEPQSWSEVATLLSVVSEQNFIGTPRTGAKDTNVAPLAKPGVRVIGI